MFQSTQVYLQCRKVLGKVLTNKMMFIFLLFSRTENSLFILEITFLKITFVPEFLKGLSVDDKICLPHISSPICWLWRLCYYCKRVELQPIRAIELEILLQKNSKCFQISLFKSTGWEGKIRQTEMFRMRLSSACTWVSMKAQHTRIFLK